MDWKEALMAQSREMGIEPTGQESAPEPAPEAVYEPAAHPPLHILMERKGRAGKTATIIEGFVWPDAEVRKVAAALKTRLGTGGSARGGEILLQGDVRQAARQALTALGFRRLKG